MMRRDPIALDPLRAQFPALHQRVHDRALIYLDSASTALKPRTVIDSVVRVYERDCANVRRGVHLLSQRATDAYEAARDQVASTLGGVDRHEIVFVRGTTEAINLVAQSWARPRLGPGDRILLTALEHHANIVPWQLLRDQTGVELDVAPIDASGQVDVDAFAERLGPRVKLVALSHVSNALGSVLPVRTMARLAHDAGAVVLCDGAQAVPHFGVAPAELGCDFYAFSGHKVYGPTGIGALWARRELLEQMAPYQGGGEMIRSVTFEKTIYDSPPHRFEAGTPNIAGAIGLGAALAWLEQLDRDALAERERALIDYAERRLGKIPGLRRIGTATERIGVLSFSIDGVHPHDVGTVADAEGVAVRSGHHCAQPALACFGVEATVRASLALYNRQEDIDALVGALRRVRELFPLRR